MVHYQLIVCYILFLYVTGHEPVRVLIQGLFLFSNSPVTLDKLFVWMKLISTGWKGATTDYLNLVQHLRVINTKLPTVSSTRFSSSARPWATAKPDRAFIRTCQYFCWASSHIFSSQNLCCSKSNIYCSCVFNINSSDLSSLAHHLILPKDNCTCTEAIWAENQNQKKSL